MKIKKINTNKKFSISLNTKKIFKFKDYIFFVFLLFLSTIVLITAFTIKELEHTLLQKKDEILNAERTIRKYIKDVKRLEGDIKKFNLKVYKKEEASHILLNFIESLRKKYKINIYSFKEKSDHIEAKITIEIKPSRKKLKKIITQFLSVKTPIVKIESIILQKEKVTINIDLNQPFYSTELNSEQSETDIPKI